MNSLPVLVAFAATIVLVVHPVTIRCKGRACRLDYASGPLVAVGFLLATLQASPSAVLDGIMGNGTLRPYSIIVLFFSLAYTCISIDMTGFFAYLALRSAKGAGTSARKLYLSFFALSSLLTIITSNDIVILTLTPIILYFCKYTNMNPWPFLVSQFLAANIFSTMLYIGNPTNIIVAQAYNLDFLEYLTWMLFPTLAAGGTCLLLAWIIVGRRVPATFTPPPGMNPSDALKDKKGAVFGILMLGSCLALLVVAPLVNLDMGLTCFAFACAMLVKDVVHDARGRRKDASKNSTPAANVKTGISRVPWKVMPFVFGMFILVEMLDQAGWVAMLGGFIHDIQSTLGVTGTIFFTCLVTALACNLLNNQPMTILFTKVLQGGTMVPATITRASMLALVLGSNFGANFTLVGALAGIMWSNITRSQGFVVKPREFSKIGFSIMPAVIVVACTVLALQFAAG